jgi:hypothetical protein
VDSFSAKNAKFVLHSGNNCHCCSNMCTASLTNASFSLTNYCILIGIFLRIWSCNDFFLYLIYKTYTVIVISKETCYTSNINIIFITIGTCCWTTLHFQVRLFSTILNCWYWSPILFWTKENCCTFVFIVHICFNWPTFFLNMLFTFLFNRSILNSVELFQGIKSPTHKVTPCRYCQEEIANRIIKGNWNWITSWFS